MSPKRTTKSGHNGGVADERGMRPVVKWTALAMTLCCVAALAWHFRGQSSKNGVQTSEGSQITNAAPRPAVAKPRPSRPARLPAAPVRNEPAGTATAAGSKVPALPSLAAPPAFPAIAVDPQMGALVAGLKQLTGTNATLSDEAVGVWRTNFMQLVRSGPAAIPALRAFLDQKTDFPFSRLTWQSLGYASARVAAIDALRQIGGPDAVMTMETLLTATQSPREIAILARNLKEASPGQYREQALAVARAALQTAASSTDPQLDVAPLFEVLQHYGDSSTISDLENAMKRWKYYATAALANLPEGAGIPAILRMADLASGSGNRIVALEMVAQLATSNPDVRQFLAAQVANKAIAPNLWPYLAGPLAGDQYYPVDSAITQYPQVQSWNDVKTTHLAYGNQNLYTLPGALSLTTEGIQQRLALVDELLKATSDPAAVQALQRARDNLTKRSARAAAQAPPAATPAQ